MKDPYVYEDTGTLRNKFGIKDYEQLRQAEADISFVKLLTVDRDVDCTKFDLEYVKNIHKYILCDIYDWAGEFRTVPMEKPEDVLGGDTVRYAYPKEIEPKAIECLNELNRINWNVKDLDNKAMDFTKLIAELWQVHPFRDGNTRTVVTYAFRFAEEHGFKMDRNLLLDHFTYVRKAFVKASDGEYSDYQYLYKIIKDSIQRGTNKNQDINSVDVAEKNIVVDSDESER